MVEFHTQSGIATVVDFFAYCYICLPFLPCYSSPVIATKQGPLSTQDLLVSKPASWLTALHLPYHGTHCMTPLPSSLLLLDSCTSKKGFLKISLYRLLPWPCVSPATSHLVALLAWSHYKYPPQRFPMCSGCLLFIYVGHFHLRSCRSPHCFQPRHLLCAIWQPSFPLPCDLPKKTRIKADTLS